jgi:hypothetical protein
VVASLALSHANIWTAVQTFTNSDLRLLGSSTGYNTFTSANSSATNYTTTVPAITDTLVTLTATQTLSNKTLTAPAIGAATGTSLALGGATLGGNALAVTGTAAISGAIAPAGGIGPASDGSGVLTNSPRLISTCNSQASPQVVSTTNAATTDSYVAELYVPANISTTGVAVLNANTVSNNNTIFLSDAAGNEVAHTASTVVAGTSVYQLIPWVGGPIAVTGPGSYYIVAQNNGTTNNWKTFSAAATGVFCGTALLTGGTYGTFPTFSPPTTYTADVGPLANLY